MKETTDIIKKLALENGFDLAGISPPSIRESSREYLRKWVEEGYFADMQYMKDSLSERVNPGNILDGARSVIVVGINYYNGPGCALEDESYGRVARYAWGEDYHRIMRDKLEKFVVAITEKTGEKFNYKITVDTSPVPEKILAYQAGLGFIGKNSLLISPKLGSWIFLGCIFTDMELYFDSPMGGVSCGNCNICIATCPTGALNKPYMLNGCRCISALTIERREYIEDDIMELVGDRVFGCDECQNRCPFNQDVPLTSAEEFRPNTAIAGFIHTEDIFSLRSNNEFRMNFSSSPLLRATRWGLVRNACIVSANKKIRDNLVFIEKLAESENAPDWVVKTAKWACRKIAQ